MANITVGSTTTRFFITDSILPAASPNTFPTGVTGLGTVNYTTGAHTFTLNANSAVHIANENVSPATPDGFLAGFAVRGNGSWGLTVNGTINALNTYVNDSAIYNNGVGVVLGNAAATVVSNLNVVTEGSIFGNAAGVYSNTFMNVTNAGLIGGGTSGIILATDGLESSNLNLSAAGVARTITITNAATGEIFGSNFGISNNSESNLIVTNAGLIAGGNTSLVFDQDGLDFDESLFEFAVQSAGRLTLTNSATGVIDGTVYSDWAGSAVTNAGKIYGTVVAQINTEYVQDTASARLDANRDGDFTDATDFLITDARLIGTTITNSGVIVGGEDYLVESVTVDTVLQWNDEGFPTLTDSGGNTVEFDQDGVPYYEVDPPVQVATMGDQIEFYYNANGDLMAGTPADWEPVFDADFLIGYIASNGTSTTVVEGLPVAYADEAAQLAIQFVEGDLNEPFYITLQSIFRYANPTAEIFETPNGDTVILGFADGQFFVATSTTEIEERQIAIDGSLLRDVVTNAAAGIIFGDVATADGADGFINAGHLYGKADMGDGNDTFTNAATGVVSAGNGNLGPLDAVDLGRGNDTATLAGKIFGNVDLGDGNDTLSVSGGIFGDVFTGPGADSVTLAASGLITGSVFLFDGNNALTNAGSIGSNILQAAGENVAGVVGLVGNDLLTNTSTGTIDYGVDLGGGADTITNNGRIYGDYRDLVAVDTGLGNDVLMNSGIIGSEFPIFTDNRLSVTNIAAEFNNGFEISLAVAMGGGDDILTNSVGSAQGNIYGFISMGAGNDTVRGGANSEYVLDDAGADDYRLGAGADAFVVDLPDNSVDVFDGGTGLNLIAFAMDDGEDPTDPPSDVVPLGHRIDLGAGRIIYEIDSFADTVTAGISATDIISNVQQVVGSDGSDVILGGAVAETLSGGDGDDSILGGGGRDLLLGDDGADVFVFTAAAQSGVTRGTRDVIDDFSSFDGDQIWLDFDSNTRAGAAGTNAANEFIFLGNNVGFTGSNYVEGDVAQNYAEVRTLMQAGMTLVEVDTNGDRLADFSIALRGFHTLEQDDFHGDNFVSLIIG